MCLKLTSLGQFHQKISVFTVENIGFKLFLRVEVPHQLNVKQHLPTVPKVIKTFSATLTYLTTNFP